MDALEQFLLNPNAVYLILVFGFLLMIMALISPGTTILEVSAFFTLLLAGWGVYHLPISLWALVILTFGVVPFLLAVRKYKHPIYLILSIASLVIGSVYLFQGEVWWQPAVNPFLAIIVSILAGGYVWIIVIKGMEAANAPPVHDLNALIGSTGEAKTDIHREGSVQVAGELWSAQSEQPIPNGSSVLVIGREGFTLLVEPNNHHP